MIHVFSQHHGHTYDITTVCAFFLSGSDIGTHTISVMETSDVIVLIVVIGIGLLVLSKTSRIAHVDNYKIIVVDDGLRKNEQPSPVNASHESDIGGSTQSHHHHRHDHRHGHRRGYRRYHRHDRDSESDDSSIDDDIDYPVIPLERAWGDTYGLIPAVPYPFPSVDVIGVPNYRDAWRYGRRGWYGVY